jgi:hypothetical protein
LTTGVAVPPPVCADADAAKRADARTDKSTLFIKNLP